jgi:hypothetical protein
VGIERTVISAIKDFEDIFVYTYYDMPAENIMPGSFYGDSLRKKMNLLNIKWVNVAGITCWASSGYQS